MVNFRMRRRHFGWRRWCLPVFFAQWMVLLAACIFPPLTIAQANNPTVFVLDVQGAIGPATTEYLQRGLAQAASEGASAVVLRMDTPGGLSSSTRDIVRDILASTIPVITYVAPSGAQAASAGTYLLYASHLAAMAPGTNVGAATPVQMGAAPSPAKQDRAKKAEESAEDSGDAMSRKTTNDAAAFIRSLADLHGRNADWAEDAVRNAVSLPAREALANGVIELMADNLDDLLTQANGRILKVGAKSVTLHTQGAAIIEFQQDWRTRFLSIITNPNIAYILLLLGLYGIIFEMMNPGAIAPGVIGAIAVLIGGFALNLLPISYAGLGLVLLGIALMVVEAFTPSFGLLGVGGVIAFVLGSLFMFDRDVSNMSLSLPLVITAAVVSATLIILVAGATLRVYRSKKTRGGNALVGRTAEVQSWTADQGVVLVRGEIWQAQGTEPLQAGDCVHILDRRGLVLTVKRSPSDREHSK